MLQLGTGGLLRNDVSRTVVGPPTTGDVPEKAGKQFKCEVVLEAEKEVKGGHTKGASHHR